MSSLNLVVFPHTSRSAIHDVCDLDITVPRKAVSRRPSSVTSETDLKCLVVAFSLAFVTLGLFRRALNFIP